MSTKVEAHLVFSNHVHSSSAITEYQEILKNSSLLTPLNEVKKGSSQSNVNSVPIPSPVTKYLKTLEDASALAPLNNDKETTWVSGGRLTFTEMTKEPDGKDLLIDLYVPPGSGTVLHRHSWENEYFYVLDGTPTFQLSNATTLTTPGDLIYGPAERPIHAFRNLTTEPLRMLLYFEPTAQNSRIEDFFRDFSQPVTNPFVKPPYDPNELVASGRKYGLEFVSALEFEDLTYSIDGKTSTATVEVVRTGSTEQLAGGTIALSNGTEIPFNVGVGENYTDVNIPLPEGSSTIDLTLKDPTDGTYIGLLGNRAVIQATPVPESSYTLGLLFFSVLGIALFCHSPRLKMKKSRR
ncbi:cupin domain-containing protein [Candidatus Gracilibacteria bacterium]|nr:cupin domain-containing protein [Candidatus Gracilibacteria bacterium]NJM86166.1 cupin domain-containing protein [Hydrococcus sp. RU_2_2]NJQ96541.1 cupin domain-containing protein [Hydrococcus sp. CSU_1_8]